MRVVMSESLYCYKAIVTDVYDGDTITVNIDLGLGVWIKGEKVRLYGIDAPEVRGLSRLKGLRSRDHLRSMILHQEVKLQTFKDKKGKYGRYLAHVFKGDIDICKHLVDKGLAKFREY